MGWKEQFSEGILREGRKLFDEGCVKGAVANSDACLARVTDGWSRVVRISGLTRGEIAGSCECEAAKEGYLCVHMAAALFARDAELGLSDGESGESGGGEDASGAEAAGGFMPGAGGFGTWTGQALNPYADDPAVRGMFYRPDLILDSVTYTKADLAAARKLAESGAVTLEQVRFGVRENWHSDRIGVVFGFADPSAGESRGGGGGGRRAGSGTERVDIVFDRKDLLSASCGACYRRIYDSSYFYSSESGRAVCRHILALLLLTSEYLKKYNPGDATDHVSERFFSRFENFRLGTRIEEGASRVPSVHIVPDVLVSAGAPALRFKISDGGRFYFVKNLAELIRAEGTRGTFEAAKKCLIDFARAEAAEDSLLWFSLIREEVRNGEILQARYERRFDYFGSDLRVRDQIDLSGEVLDHFYGEMEGRTLGISEKPAYGRQEKASLAVGDTDYSLELRVAPLFDELDGSPAGAQIYGKLPSVLRGKDANYLFGGGKLARLTPEAERAVALFSDFADETGRFEVKAGRKRLADLWYRVLPQLEAEKAIRIEREDEEEIAEILPPEAKYTFYLDAGDGLIFCRGVVSYGGGEFALRPLTDADFPLDPVRDAEGEERVRLRIADYFPDYDAEEGAHVSKNSADSAYRILSTGIGDLMRMGEVQGTDAFYRLRIRKPPRVRLGVSVASEILNLDIETDDLSRAELLDLLLSYRARKKYHRLSNGDIIELEKDESLDMLSELLDSMGGDVKKFTEGKLHLPLYRALYLSRMLEEHDGIAADRDRQFRALVKNFKTIGESDFEVPASLLKVMRNYQLYGHKWLRTLASAGFGGILADDMGLGKTLQMISVLLAAKEAGEGGLSLIICPASLVYNWLEEFARFAPELNAVPVAGPLAERKAYLTALAAGAEAPDVLITSYHLLLRAAELYDALHFEDQVLDEAQTVKNPSAAVSKAVRLIHSRHRFALTGTPIENRLSELWSIFDYLMPGFLYTYRQFSSEFETPVMKENDGAASERLRAMCAPFILRRLKGDVLKDLPDKLEEHRYARFGEEQRKLYDAQVAHMQRTLSEAEPGEKLKVLAELTKIREICCDPSLVAENYRGGSAKREACLDLIKSAVDGDHRLLLFSQFTSMLALLEEDLGKEGIPYYKITGSTPKEERLRLVHAFNGDSTPVFLISLKAGGTGLNLTGADVVIHYDPWWNLAAENQASDRAHRIGQTKKVTVYKLIAKGTVEEKIVKLQEAKQNLSDSVVQAGGNPLAALTQEELMDLLGV